MTTLTTISLNPRVHPSSGAPDAAAEANRRAILDQSTPADVKDTEEDIIQRFKSELHSVPAALRHTLPSEPTEEYWHTHYYKMLQERIEGKN